MKKVFEIALGIVTSIGGFLEAGSVATSAQAGAGFRFQLLWSVALGTLALVFLVEMAGRLSAVSGTTLAGAMRARLGFPLFVLPLVTVSLVAWLVLATELGGVSVALELASGVSHRVWAIPVVVVGWLLLWRGTFGVIEKGVSLLGLVTVAFVVAAVRLHPAWGAVAHGFVPTRPTTNGAHYWYLAVNILGATIAPYLLYFYSAGAVEDGWDEGHLGVNRAVAAIGMCFGGALSCAVMIAAGVALSPRGGRVDSYAQIVPTLTSVFGHWGLVLFVLSLGIACLGAALEVALSLAYLMAQGFGWNWSENAKPRDASRFALVYTVAMLLAVIPVVAGVDVLKLTNLSMAFTALSLPFAIGPMLILMNDDDYVGAHRNGVVSNTVVMLTIAAAFVLAAVSIPLVIVGG
ncbi:MAG TPA: divalent metal cation transporter [Gemmatimonadaceae bacterium]